MRPVDQRDVMRNIAERSYLPPEACARRRTGRATCCWGSADRRRTCGTEQRRASRTRPGSSPEAKSSGAPRCARNPGGFGSGGDAWRARSSDEWIGEALNAAGVGLGRGIRLVGLRFCFGADDVRNFRERQQVAHLRGIQHKAGTEADDLVFVELPGQGGADGGAAALEREDLCARKQLQTGLLQACCARTSTPAFGSKQSGET